ncbi:MAG: prepilin-type N-terminal cleavage/methylation domain-containing protein [Steroidobacteraceae bacterium]
MPHPRARGFTLVELMVAMVLGLIFIGGAVSLMLANRRSYTTNEGLSQVQESSRSAFELLARDIRQAGISGCDNTGRIANVLNTGPWWRDWFGMRGYDEGEASPGAAFGTGRGDRVAGTDTIQTQGIQGLGLTVQTHAPATAQLTFNVTPTAADIATGDVMIACDFDHATIFQVTAYNAVTSTVTHAAAGSSPGNSSADLGFPSGTYQFRRNALLARFGATEWYIGNSDRTTDSGRSLFRLRSSAAGPEEVVADVTNMQITYRVANSDNFVDASLVTDWPNVNAVEITLTVNSADSRISTDAAVNSGRLERQFTQIIALRNRIP